MFLKERTRPGNTPRQRLRRCGVAITLCLSALFVAGATAPPASAYEYIEYSSCSGFFFLTCERTSISYGSDRTCVYHGVASGWIWGSNTLVSDYYCWDH